jgi:ubiquitin carboxyl-terminal hydrolase 7
MEENYGGQSKGPRDIKKFTNAYMLVYIRESDIPSVLCDIQEPDIPEYLRLGVARDKEALERKRKEREELHLYLSIKVISDMDMKMHSGFDLFDFDHMPCLSFKVKKDNTFADVKKLISQETGLQESQFRLWSMIMRQNKTLRPDQPIPDSFDTTCKIGITLILDIEQVKDTLVSKMNSDFRLYLDTDIIGLPNIEVGSPTSPKDGKNSINAIFIKYYNPMDPKLHYIGKLAIPSRSVKLQDIVPTLNNIIGLAPDTPVKIYEEVKPDMIDQVKLKNTFSQAELGDGDILTVQPDLTSEQYFT